MYKRKHPERFDAWWRPLTRQGDPSHRYDLVGEAFDAGYEAGKGAALLTLGRKLIEQYAMPHDADPPLGMEAHMAERLAQETPVVPVACGEDIGFNMHCRRVRGHAGPHAHSPKMLFGEDPV